MVTSLGQTLCSFPSVFILERTDSIACCITSHVKHASQPQHGKFLSHSQYYYLVITLLSAQSSFQGGVVSLCQQTVSNIILNMCLIWHSLMLLWFADLMNVTEEFTIHRPNVLTLLSSAFIRGDLDAATRGPFIWSLISGLFSDKV